eukprot:11708973-Prorocentrum_lima.AAC.1
MKILEKEMSTKMPRKTMGMIKSGPMTEDGMATLATKKQHKKNSSLLAKKKRNNKILLQDPRCSS